MKISHWFENTSSNKFQDAGFVTSRHYHPNKASMEINAET